MRLRYYKHPATGLLECDHRALIKGALEGIEEQVSHAGDAAKGTVGAAYARAKGRARVLLRQQKWLMGLMMTGAALASSVLWWLPLAYQRALGRLYIMVHILPLTVFVVAALQLGILEHMRRALASMTVPTRLTVGALRPMPIHLITPHRWRYNPRQLAVRVLVALVLFNMTLGRVGLGPPEYDIIVHAPGQEALVYELLAPLPPGAWWELAPQFIEGHAYGLIYYNTDTDLLLVIELRYKVTNPGGAATKDSIRDMAGAWASNIAQFIRTGLLPLLPAWYNESQRQAALLERSQSMVDWNDIAATVRAEAIKVFGGPAEVELSLRVITSGDYRRVMY